MISLFLISSLLHVTICNVYTVTPDDDNDYQFHHFPNTRCHHCHNLQHYLLNVTRYFTSNTQLLFLPGIHHLHTDLIIQKVHNISIIGSTANDTSPVSVIQCYPTSDGIVIINSTIVTIRNFVLTNYEGTYYGASFDFLSCYYIELHNMEIHVMIKGHNVMGKSKMSNVTSNGLDILYDDNAFMEFKEITNKLEICNYKTTGTQFAAINVKISQTFYAVSIVITNSVFSQLHDKLAVFIASNLCSTPYENKVLFHKIHFTNNHDLEYLLYIQFDLRNNCTSAFKDAKVILHECLFTDSSNISAIIYCEWFHEDKIITQALIIHSCLFTNNTYCKNILDFMSHSTTRFISMQSINMMHVYIVIVNTNFTSNVCNIDKCSAMVNSVNTLDLHGPIIIHGNSIESLFAIHKSSGSTIMFQGYIEFSENIATYMIKGHVVVLMEHVVMNVTRNVISCLFMGYKLQNVNHHIPMCYFQFFGSQKSITNKTFRVIIEYTNLVPRIFNEVAENINCRMLQNTLFYNHNPLQVYQQFIFLQDDFKHITIPFDTGILCYCLEEIQECKTNQLGPIYPGQILTIHLQINQRVKHLNNILISLEMYSEFLPRSHCKLPLSSKTFNVITRNCTKFYYTVLSNNEGQCELFLNARKYEYVTIFYIQLLRCPMGFAIDVKTEKCECDLSMQSKVLTIQYCNINDQTILRPANSWLTAETYNDSSTYHISPNCPFHYCLPQSSHLNFSTPNSQCQFNRSGLLCGECQQSLSAVFGSSNCQPCSNTYVLLIIPIAIAGVLLVFILFCINLTVTDGTINAFIIYTNIISINDHVFFTDTKHVFMPVYTFISLANLDLGIQTCFYNGMDDYAKMWLQLAFPFYLIFIATLLIITSRYSITVQRLTARRALPVLATLFLLSYTKILRTVSSVLFSYSTITHLPSKHTTVVWSVDANVPLFGIKFTLLFIACLILFLVLIPFNIILLFTKILSRFQFINKFRPFLDAYQGPYKFRFYYWTGLQLLVRALFYGISALDRNINLTIGSIILSVMIGLHGVVYPFKNNFKNNQELLYIINLQVLYILTLSEYQGVTSVNVLVTVAAVQFIFIIIYHIITYSYSRLIRIKINHFTKTVITWISKLNKSSNVDIQLNNIEIPEVTYNYREFREPLIGQD